MSRFSDFDLTFIAHPRSGRVANLDAKTAIYRALNHILMIRPGEKFYNEDFGIGMQNQLFELSDFIALDVLKTEIKNHIKNYEPRITIEDVILENNLHNLEITIQFYLKSNPQELLTFERTIRRIR